MNTNPQAKRILCFGDSNTKGAMPWTKKLGDRRYPVNVRWTGILQNALGSAFEIIENGLGGRTINSQHPRLETMTKGLISFRNTLSIHEPISLCVLHIGINDIQDCYEFNATQLEDDLKQYKQILFERHPDASLLVLNSPLVSDPHFHSAGAIDKCKLLRQIIEKLFNVLDKKIFYLDLNDHVTYSAIDDLHMDEENHRILGNVMVEKIKEILD